MGFRLGGFGSSGRWVADIFVKNRISTSTLVIVLDQLKSRPTPSPVISGIRSASKSSAEGA